MVLMINIAAFFCGFAIGSTIELVFILNARKLERASGIPLEWAIPLVTFMISIAAAVVLCLAVAAILIK